MKMGENFDYADLVKIHFLWLCGSEYASRSVPKKKISPQLDMKGWKRFIGKILSLQQIVIPKGSRNTAETFL